MYLDGERVMFVSPCSPIGASSGVVPFKSNLARTHIAHAQEVPRVLARRRREAPRFDDQDFEPELFRERLRVEFHLESILLVHMPLRHNLRHNVHGEWLIKLLSGVA